MSRRTGTGTKRGEGLDNRLKAFYTANPDEELTVPDVVDKFGGTPHSAKQSIYRLVKAGMLERANVIRRKQGGKT